MPLSRPLFLKAPFPLSPVTSSANASTGIRFSFFYAALFLMLGVYWPFLPIWLEAQDLSLAQVGLLMTVFFWTRFFWPPAFAYLARAQGNARRPILAMGATAFIAAVLYAVDQRFWWLIAITILSSAAVHSVLPLGEALATQAARQKLFDYGRVRLWGSVTFIIATLLGGALIEGAGLPSFLFWIAVTSGLLCLSIAWLPIAALDKRDGLVPASSEQGRDGPVTSWLTLRFVTFLAAASLIQAAHGLFYSFGVIDWQRAGMGGTLVGALWAISIIAEIALFALAGSRLRTVSPFGFLVLGALGSLLRWPAMALAPGPLALVPLQALHALTFGATHMAVILFFAREVPGRFLGTAQSSYAALATGAMMGIATSVGTTLYQQAGTLSYLAMAGFAAIGSLLLFVLYIQYGHRLTEAPHSPVSDGPGLNPS